MPPDPHLRGFLDDPPEYGNDETLFTMEVHHNGFFCGVRDELSYVSASVEHWDHCCTDTWSILWMNDLLKQMDYERDERMHVYWFPPGKRSLEEGLVCIETDAHLVEMMKSVGEDKTVALFLDHTNMVKNLRPEVIMSAVPEVAHAEEAAYCAPLVSVVMHESEDTPGATGSETFEDLARAENRSDDSEDSDWFDSDYDAEDGDDDLFLDSVDKEVNDNNEPEEVQDLEDDTALDDGELNFREEVEDHLHIRFREFNGAVDMKNPVFKLGMVFSGVKEVRQALQSYSIKNRVKVNKTRNDPKRVEAVCKAGCTWCFKASKDTRNDAFTVKTYVEKHTCRRSYDVKALTASFLCDAFMNEFIDNRNMNLKSFAAKVQREYNMCPNRWKLGRARKEALLKIHGDEASQFSLLWDYGQEMRRANPGSKFLLSTNKSKDSTDAVPKEHLATLYWSYDACKRGFLQGCRPFICVDGCHVKTKFKGILLTAVGIDPNDCIYPIAMGLVEVECTSSWEWFLTTLRDDLNITNTAPWTIMSDKQKGLINAVQKVFPDAEHRFCVRHLHQNFQKAGHKGEGLKNDMWAIARSTNMVKYQHSLDKLKADSVAAFDWVEQLRPNTWVKAFFSDFPKCDMLLNNHCEVFNSYILEAREMPMLSMLETIFYKIMQRIVSKQKEPEKWTGTICPKIRKKLDKFMDWSSNCIILSGSDGEYRVSSSEMERDYVVNLETKSCDCKRWQLSGIPCHHVLACCKEDRIDPESLVHSCYSIETYKKAYANNLHPLRGRGFWEKMNGVVVHPPLYTKVMGRPKKNRRKAPEEKVKHGVPTLSRHGLTMHCSICGNSNHNRKGHDKYMLNQQVDNPAAEEINQQDADEDDPTILEHIAQQYPLPQMDPMHQRNSMVYRMGQEDRAHAQVRRLEIPLPDENAFVAAARESLPPPRSRLTTASTRGRGRASRPRAARGAASTSTTTSRPRAARGAASTSTTTSIPRAARGAASTSTTTSIPRAARGTAQKRTAESSSSGATAQHDDSTRGRRRTRGYSTAPGSMHHLLFGPVQVPDLNVVPPDSTEEVIPISQNAPADGNM